MRTQDGFYFSPHNAFMSLRFDDKEGLIILNTFQKNIKLIERAWIILKKIIQTNRWLLRSKDE